MEAVIISGYLREDVECFVDNRGHECIRFCVICESGTVQGLKRHTVYRCQSGDIQHKDLKRGDLVFILGFFLARVVNGKAVLDVYVSQLARGFKM